MTPHRLLPGRNSAGQPVCRDCAGITSNFTCTRCQTEVCLRTGLCRRCTFTDDLQALLGDGTGQVNPRLLPLFDKLATMANPASGQRWISKPRPQALLTTCGILEPVDRQILAVQADALGVPGHGHQP